MRVYASFSLAFGLVAASPCKPLTSGSTAVSDISTLTESVTSGVETLVTETSTVIESDTSTTIDTTATDASTIIESTSTEFTDVTISTSEASSQATSGTTLFTSATADITVATTETSAIETTTSPETTTTGTIETSTIEMSATTTTTADFTVMATTTTSEASPTDYPLIAGQGPAQGLPLKTNQQPGAYMIFGQRTSSWTPGRFLVDPTSGYLTQNGVPVCAQYRYMNRNAALVLCPTESYQYGTSRLTCTRSPAPGTALQCSAVKLDCVASGPGDNQRCTVSSEANWTKFFIATGSDYTWYLGADNLASPYYTPLDVFVDRAPIVVTPTES